MTSRLSHILFSRFRLSRIRTLALESPQQFRPAAPNPLGSQEYAADFEEVRRFGRFDTGEKSFYKEVPSRIPRSLVMLGSPRRALWQARSAERKASSVDVIHAQRTRNWR
jgi:hypothetical protein